MILLDLQVSKTIVTIMPRELNNGFDNKPWTVGVSAE